MQNVCSKGLVVIEAVKITTSTKQQEQQEQSENNFESQKRILNDHHQYQRLKSIFCFD